MAGRPTDHGNERQPSCPVLLHCVRLGPTSTHREDRSRTAEQQRDSFALYLRHRLTGIGGESIRGSFADIDAYPEFKAEFTRGAATKEFVSNTAQLPAAIGAVTYADPGVIQAECADFGAALAGQQGRYTEAFLTAPSPGIVAAIMQNRHYATDQAYAYANPGTVAVRFVRNVVS